MADAAAKPKKPRSPRKPREPKPAQPALDLKKIEAAASKGAEEGYKKMAKMTQAEARAAFKAKYVKPRGAKYKPRKPTRAYYGIQAQRSRPSMVRVVHVGPGGGLRPVAAYNPKKTPGAKRFSDMDAAKKIIAALPGVAISLGAASMGAKYLASNATVQDIKSKLPGGGNTLALLVGGGIGWIAYKYKSLIGVLTGLGVAAYALIKLGNREANLLPGGGAPMTIDAEDSGTDDKMLPADAGPGAAATQPSKTEPGDEDFAEGIAALKVERWDEAIQNLQRAYMRSKNGNILYYLAKGLHGKALDEKARGQGLAAAADAKSAISMYRKFIEEGHVSKAVTQEMLDRGIADAKAQIEKIRSDPWLGGKAGTVAGTEYVGGTSLEVGAEVLAGEDDEDEGVEGEDDDDDDEE